MAGTVTRDEKMISVALSDEQLAEWLSRRITTSVNLLMITSLHQFKIGEVGSAESSFFLADPDTASLGVLKSFVKRQRLCHLEVDPQKFETPGAELHSSIPIVPIKQAQLEKWYKHRNSLFGIGRGKDISKQTAHQVTDAAAGRCMYRGCGENLGHTPLTTKAARIHYLAHIVASDPDGPRGNKNSHSLSDDAENIMLMCDAHHRLIDRIDVAGHSELTLRLMRAEHVERVNFLLRGLSFPRTKLITIFSDIANIPSAESPRDMRDSVLQLGLGPLGDIASAIRRTQRDDRARPDFWWHLLHEHEQDIRHFIALNRQGNINSEIAPPEVLAFFPLHLVPVLVLAGRIVGEARNTQVFQYHRDLKTWRWSTANALSSGAISFQRPIIKQSREVILSLELTADVDQQALPSELTQLIKKEGIPWIRITNSKAGPNCISSLEDLEQFTKIARAAISVIQDEIRPDKVHMIGVSPASTLFKFGQLLQPGHHPCYQIYDRSDRESPFAPTIQIDGNRVYAMSSSHADPLIINLR